MHNIDVDDVVALNPNGLDNGACNVVWGRHNNNVNGMGKVLRINRNRVGVDTANVQPNGGGVPITLPIACLREHYSAGGGKKKRKVKSKRKKSKKRKPKRRLNKTKRRSKKK